MTSRNFAATAPNGPSDDNRTRMVFITRDIDQDYIEDTFALIERIAGCTAALRQGTA